MKITHAAHLTDSQLVNEVSRLARGEREATVALIVHLAEFDARRLCEAAGFPSTFEYCVKVLRLSEDAAVNRIKVARMARRYPVVLDMLTTGTLSPTTALTLARHVTAENHQGLLAAASGKGKRAVEKLLAERFPQPDVPSSVRRLRAPAAMGIPIAAPTTTLVASPPFAHRDGRASQASADSRVQASITAPAPPIPVVRPLAAERYEIRFTASAQTCEKLRRAQDLLGHAAPSGDLAQVFDRALDLLVADLERKKFAATDRPRRSPGQSEGSRNIPAAVRRAVWKRDDGRCAFVASNGRRCGAQRFLEFHHHDQPYGVGGKPTVDNIQLRCGVHNRYEAELFYGPSRRHEAGAVSPSTVPGRVPACRTPQPVMTSTATARAGRSSA
jgi:hypothetical protein